MPILFFHINPQGDLSSRTCCKSIACGNKISGNQGKKIAWLGIGILPDCIMPGGVKIALLQAIAVGEQHRTRFFIRLDPGGKPGKHIGAIKRIGDPAKSLRLTLGAIVAAASIKPAQRSIVVGMDNVCNGQCKFVGRIIDFQHAFFQAIALLLKWCIVNCNSNQLKVLAMELQNTSITIVAVVAIQLCCSSYLGSKRFELEHQIH